MRIITIIGSLLFALASFAQNDCLLLNEKLQADTARKSVKTQAAAAWGRDSVVINWYSPAVRNRTIWGGLVPYTEVWATGAHFATNIEFREKVLINGVKVNKGRYALFTIPRQNDWIVILNKNWEQHLADEYDPNDDVVRVTVQPHTGCSPAERLQWGFLVNDTNTGMLYMRWEKVQVAVPVSR